MEVLVQAGFGVRAIGRELKRDASVISRERRRNASPCGGYCAGTAQRTAESRREKQRGARKESPEVMDTIREGLEAGWSPEQIACREELEGREFVSHQWIYEALERDRLEGGQLYRKLWRRRRRGRKRNRGKKASSQRIPNRVSISERPGVVERRERYGDWESDLIEGKGGGYLITCVERKSRFMLLCKVPTKNSEVVSWAETRLLAPFRVRTITRDNGLEFARHEHVNESLGCGSYFCEPYHSWERGLVENRNGLVRRYLPKGSSFKGVGRVCLERIEDELNSRPHEVLGWRAPVEFIDKILLS